MSAQAVNRPQTGGCLKCGEKGHWARDCTAPREKWLPRNNQSQQINANTQAGATQNGAIGDPTERQENNPAAPLLGAAAAARQKQKRPKLTYDDLKKTSGLPEIYHNFPTVFKSQFRGKGHELSDLRRLLEMYKRWQDRVFAHGSFDNFIATIEKIGATNIVKKDMSDMRMDLLKTVEDALAPPAEEAAAGGDADMFNMFGGAEDNQNTGAEEEELAIDSDEELLELAAAPMAAAAAQAGGADGGAEDVDMDDEELLELAMQGQGNNNVNTGTNTNNEAEIDDDELLEMAMQG